nr:hypothetical protein CFP56_14696 [Quercus suber]
MPSSASSSHRVPLLINHKFKDLKKKGLQHYELLARLFNSNIATDFLQISSAQPTPNSDKERAGCSLPIIRGTLCNELKRLHLLEEDTSIVSVEEAVGTVLFIVRHNADYQLTANRFQHSLETIQR